MNELFNESDPDDDGISFKTKGEYARKYDAWREKEELHKLEQKYGDKALHSDIEASSDSEDDDAPPEISEKMETAFLKTLSLLKNKDPRIYDPDYTFFDDMGDENATAESTDHEVKTKPKKEVSSLAAAFADSDSEDEKGEIFKIEKKAPQTRKKDDELKKYLIGKQEHVAQDVEEDLAPLKALWSDPKLNEGEAFLRDYILNKRYLDDGEADIVHGKLLDDETLDADEEMIEEQGKFERAYNFRFEEPDQEYLKRYPRTMNCIRPKDDKRARKRAEVRTRKEEEKKRKMEEIARLKALKLKEIQEKIAKIKEVTGNEDLAFKEEDIEGDFDPEEHDRRMKAIFDQEYYEDNPDMEKPVFPDLDDELEIENWENYDEKVNGEIKNEDGPHCEDEDFNMDADYDPNEARKGLMEHIQETLGKKRRNRKKKSQLAELLSTDKPKYMPTNAEKSYADYMEEYYKIDCEDVIGGDLPTRFKYREVVPNSFGLSIEEILLADDRDLNKWVSLKKTVKYRPDHVEKGEVKIYQQKAQDVELKKKILPSLFNEVPEEPHLVVPTDSKKKKKKRKKSKTKEQSDEKINKTNPGQNSGDNTKKKNKNREEDESKIKNTELLHKIVEVNPERNIDNRKTKNKKCKERTGEILDNVEQNVLEFDTVINVFDNTNIKKKKKKVKQQTKGSDCISEHLNGTVNNKKDDETAVNDNIKNKKRIKHKITGEMNSSKSKRKKIVSETEISNSIFAKKKKNKNKNNDNNKNKKQSNDTDDNPLSKLSDERLKAYGLNPKKYRSFLKYKKF